MAGGIVYLDIDDEITSAAARVREMPGRRVAVVLPYGSRVATSRINFRLLSRDALINEKQLAVVAGDSATRALAASAGLPVFSTVAEYESSFAVPADEAGPPPPEAGPPPPAAPTQPTADATPAAAPGGEPSKRTRRGSKATASGANAAAAAAAAGVAAVSSETRAPTPSLDASKSPPAGGATPAVRDETVRVEIPREEGPLPREPEARPWAAPRQPAEARDRFQPQPRPGSRRASRLPIVIVLAALGLVLLVGGVAAYVMLPSATVVVTPRAEDLVLPELTITADPTVGEPNADARVIPSEGMTSEARADDTFPATGKRVEETASKGVVRFSNLDFLRTNNVPAGSIVSTNAGVRFRTLATITVPKADLVGLTVFPGRKNVGVSAIEPGTAGNVEPNTIVIVPKGEDPQALKVVNPDATSGGTHEEFPKVTQEDVDSAVSELTKRLESDQVFVTTAKAANPNSIVFEESLTREEPILSVDPASLVGKEVATFDLEMRVKSTIVIVDPAPLTPMAEELIRAAVKPGYELVADSILVDVGSPSVSGHYVTLPVGASAKQVAILDADELRSEIVGKPLEVAREILERYGEVKLTTWPDWVGSIPTIADRVEVRVEQGVPVETPPPAASESAS